MNKTILMGRLVADPELKQTTTNKIVCTFKIAVNRQFKRDEADFFPIVTWEKTAEFCGKYFQKGRQVAVVGRLQNRSWDDTEGKKHYITEIIADEAFFADSKPSGDNDTVNLSMEDLMGKGDELPF